MRNAIQWWMFRQNHSICPHVMQTVSSPKDFHRKYCIWCAPLHAHCTLNRIHNIVRDIKCTLCCRTMYILYRIWNMYIVQNKGNKVSAYRERQTVYELLNRFALIAGGGGGDIWRKHVIFHKNMSYILVFSKVNIIFWFICHLFIKGETNSRISIKIVECSINCSIKNRQFQRQHSKLIYGKYWSIFFVSY